MNTVSIINVYAVVDVPKDENHTGRRILCLRNNGVQSLRRGFNILMPFHVFEQIKPELVKSQIHDRNTARHILNVHNFFLQPLELRTTIFKVAFFLGIDQVVVTGGGHDRNLHAGLHAAFQVDILVEVHIRPEVYKLDMVVFTADTVNSSEPLDNANRVPMNVVVDEVVAVLQVLTFGNTVSCNQNIKLVGASGQEYSFALRNRREAGQHRVEIGSELWNGSLTVNCAGDLCRFQPEILFRKSADVCKEIVCGIRECRENDDLLIARIDGMLDFLLD